MKDYDVFLSWTGADRELKDALREYLEGPALGESFACYDSDRDCKGDFREDFAFSMEKAKVYLLLLTPHLFHNPYENPDERFSVVRQELRYAGDLESVGKLNFVILTTVPINAKPTSDMEKFYAAHTAGFSKTYCNLEDLTSAFEKIKKQVGDFLSARQEGKPVPSIQPELPILREAYVEPSAPFIGRKEEFQKLQQAFDEGTQIIVLSGVGGIGKTELSRKFASDSPYLFPQTIVYADDLVPSLENFVVKIKYPTSTYENLSLMMKERQVDYLLSTLMGLKEDTLLLLDNVNALTPFFLKQLRGKFSCRFLITTRADLSTFPEIAGVSYQSILPLSLKEAMDIFSSHYGEEVIDQKRFEEQIYVPYSGNTQAIILTAKMLKEQGISVEDFYSRREEHLQNNLFSHEIHGEEHFDTVSKTLADFFAITKFLDKEGPYKDILALLSGLSIFGIEEKRLKSLLGLQNSNDVILLWKNGLLNRERRGDDYYLKMHSIIAEALNLNGVFPSPKQTEDIRSYLVEKLDDEEFRISSDTLNSLTALLKKQFLSHPHEEKKKENKDSYTIRGNGDEPLDILDVLLDEDNDDPLVLSSNNGMTYTFDQIAVIPYNEKVYAILKPVEEIEGITDDQAVVFYVEEREGGPSTLQVEADEATAVEVFKKYYALLLKST